MRAHYALKTIICLESSLRYDRQPVHSLFLLRSYKPSSLCPHR